MNMIPLVMANEPGRAQYVNLQPWLPNCSLDRHHQLSARRKSFWKKASERVRIPSVVEARERTVCLIRVAFFGTGAQNVW